MAPVRRYGLLISRPSLDSGEGMSIDVPIACQGETLQLVSGEEQREKIPCTQCNKLVGLSNLMILPLCFKVGLCDRTCLAAQ